MEIEVSGVDRNLIIIGGGPGGYVAAISFCNNYRKG